MFLKTLHVVYFSRTRKKPSVHTLNQYLFFNTYRVLQKNSHPLICCHITLDAPAPPQSMLLTGPCRHPNGNGCFFEGCARQSYATTLNQGDQGDGGLERFFGVMVAAWLFF